MNLKLALPLASLLALAGGAFAQGRISPQSIIVNPTPTDLQVNVAVDRAGANPVYTVGENIRLSVTVNQDAYVYLFSIHADGSIDLVLPNRFQGGAAFLRANETRTFPPAGATFQFNIGGPAGQDKVLAVASRRELNIDEIARFQGNSQFATVTVQGANQAQRQENLARALSIVVEPIPQTDWVTDVAYYQVRGRAVTQPAPSTGNVVIDGVPAGASVYIDGQLVGQAPATFVVTPGRHTIRVTLDGYRDFSVTVTVGAGGVVRAPVQLVQLPREGTLSLRSNVANALVFVNGAQVGRVSSAGSLNIGNLPVGTHEVVVIAPGFRTFVGTFSIQAGQVTGITAALAR